MSQDARQAALRQMQSRIDLFEGLQEDRDISGEGWNNLQDQIDRLRRLVRFHERRVVQRERLLGG